MAQLTQPIGSTGVEEKAADILHGRDAVDHDCVNKGRAVASGQQMVFPVML